MPLNTLVEYSMHLKALRHVAEQDGLTQAAAEAKKHMLILWSCL